MLVWLYELCCAFLVRYQTTPALWERVNTYDPTLESVNWGNQEVYIMTSFHQFSRGGYH